MSTLKPNNPAAHLHELLSKLCRMPETNPAKSCLSQALFVSESDVVKLTNRIHEMAQLVDQIEDQLLAVPNLPSTELYRSWKPAVMAALGSVAFVGPLKQITDILKEKDGLALERLKYCADLLERERAEKDIEVSELVALKQDIEALVKQTKESEIEAELKLFILHQLGTLKDSIDEYQMFGIEALSRGANSVTGSLFLNLGDMARRKAFERAAGDKFWKIFKRHSQNCEQ